MICKCGHSIGDHGTLAFGFGKRPLYTGCNGNHETTLWGRCPCRTFEKEDRG